MITDPGLSPEEIARIAGFLGYGEPADSIWFIGKEEGLGDMDEDDAMKNLRARATFDSIMDLYRAHLRLWEKGIPIDFERKIPRTQVWKFMAKIMRARDGHKTWNDKVEANDYIRSQLGRSGGQTFMTELSPIPASSKTDEKWMQMFERLDPQLARKLEDREENLKRLLKQCSPRLVICYGLPKAKDFAKLLCIEWEPFNERILKSADSRCLLLPFFGQGQMSGDIIEQMLNAKLLR